jgi:hypothetical protein
MLTFLMNQSPVIVATGTSLIIFLLLVALGWALKKKANIDIGSFFNSLVVQFSDTLGRKIS